MDHPLDNPVWNSLTTGNKSLSKGNEQVKYFSKSISPFVGLPGFSLYEFNLLYHIIPSQRKLAIIASKEVAIPNQWVVLEHMKVLQMVYSQAAPPDKTSPKLIHLQKKHVDQMVTLTQMAHPGPFFKRTIEFGNYEGIFDNEDLVAMAGQRLHANQYTEISAVCTHPDHLCKGYATQLLVNQIHNIIAASGIPFLHVKDENAKAIHLYKKLGFEPRKQMDIYMIEKN